MGIDISALDRLMPEAIRHFWKARLLAAKMQKKRGVLDQGNRSGVTAGKNLDALVAMVRDIIVANGIPEEDVHYGRRASVTIPGFYRPTKNWDLLVVSQGRLLAAIEFKSQVGPSFGNNFNNRVEEALGNAADLNTAFREGVFGESPRPFVGYFFVLEECLKSTMPIKFVSPHFSGMPEFENASYAARYEILCRKLVQEQLYDAAALVLTDRRSGSTGTFRTASELTCPRRFAATLAGTIAAMTA
ncbi:MAG: Type-2 restriction enzyme PaeR7I [Planctomycetes bacterium ADurb.Bin126]|nr:MAG: Type-2 restriction enzyme PaeR7I [Planctomycetes bacterium ADurb.Bin126]HOD81521.1 PaeR7I family type II restriction endonuclease [Phycisphaerae bacterium]HQL73995.1 PaeR7I family type II restriction endonuclease [Phycisphaerae bacterium]